MHKFLLLCTLVCTYLSDFNFICLVCVIQYLFQLLLSIFLLVEGLNSFQIFTMVSYFLFCEMPFDGVYSFFPIQLNFLSYKFMIYFYIQTIIFVTNIISNFLSSNTDLFIQFFFFFFDLRFLCLSTDNPPHLQTWDLWIKRPTVLLHFI